MANSDLNAANTIDVERFMDHLKSWVPTTPNYYPFSQLASIKLRILKVNLEDNDEKDDYRDTILFIKSIAQIYVYHYQSGPREFRRFEKSMYVLFCFIVQSCATYPSHIENYQSLLLETLLDMMIHAKPKTIVRMAKNENMALALWIVFNNAEDRKVEMLVLRLFFLLAKHMSFKKQKQHVEMITLRIGFPIHDAEVDAMQNAFLAHMKFYKRAYIKKTEIFKYYSKSCKIGGKFKFYMPSYAESLKLIVNYRWKSATFEGCFVDKTKVKHSINVTFKDINVKLNCMVIIFKPPAIIANQYMHLFEGIKDAKEAIFFYF